jgi:hypothetical protein
LGIGLPLFSNLKVNLVILLVLGMAICAQGGIGRVAAAGQWVHPLSIFGYLMGVLILAGSLAVFLNWSPPFTHSDRQVLLAISGLVGTKFVLSGVHELVSRRQKPR